MNFSSKSKGERSFFHGSHIEMTVCRHRWNLNIKFARSYFWHILLQYANRGVSKTCCPCTGGCSAGGTQQLTGRERRPDRPGQSAGHVRWPRHALREKTQPAAAAVRAAAGGELQVRFRLGFGVAQETSPSWLQGEGLKGFFGLCRLEAAKDDYRIHCEELEKQLIEVQHRNDELTSLAEESRALKDELDVLRSVGL